MYLIKNTVNQQFQITVLIVIYFKQFVRHMIHKIMHSALSSQKQIAFINIKQLFRFGNPNIIKSFIILCCAITLKVHLHFQYIQTQHVIFGKKTLNND